MINDHWLSIHILAYLGHAIAIDIYRNNCICVIWMAIMCTAIFKGGPADGHYRVDDTRRSTRVPVPLPVHMIAALDDGLGDVPRRTVAYEADGSYAFDGSRVYRIMTTV